MASQVSVSALIRFLGSNEGGRRTSASSGYRPTIRFGDLYTAGAIDFLDREVAEPGDECEAHIRFSNPGYVEEFLKPNQRFDITEGIKKVGEGMIIMVWES